MIIDIKNNFEEEVLNSKEIVIVDFYATWCMPCKILAPIVEKVAEEDEIKLAKVDVDENEALVRKYGIMSVPTLKFFKDGKEVDSAVGVLNEKQIRNILNK